MLVTTCPLHLYSFLILRFRTILFLIQSRNYFCLLGKVFVFTRNISGSPSGLVFPSSMQAQSTYHPLIHLFCSSALYRSCYKFIWTVIWIFFIDSFIWPTSLSFVHLSSVSSIHHPSNQLYIHSFIHQPVCHLATQQTSLQTSSAAAGNHPTINPSSIHPSIMPFIHVAIHLFLH